MPKFVKSELTAEAARVLLDYLPATGELFWVNRWYYKDRTRVRNKAGCVAVYKTVSYLLIKIDGRLYPAHRVIWLIHYGKWPEGVIDHIDGDGLNNRISNLRDVSHRDNLRNTKKRREGKAFPMGVTYCKNRIKRPWRASIVIDGVRVGLGVYSTVEEAAKAREDYEIKHLR